MAHYCRSASAAKRAAEAATEARRAAQAAMRRDLHRLRVSKKMCYILRHDHAAGMGRDGFLSVDALLQLCPVTTADICDVAEEWSQDRRGNRRFEMTERADGSFWIRATGGHSFNVDQNSIYSPPRGLTGNRTENHKRACQKLKASSSEPKRSPAPEDKASSSESKRSPAPEDNSCVICLTEGRTHAVIPCGHRCLCSYCAEAFQKQSSTCPLCQLEFVYIVQIYD